MILAYLNVVTTRRSMSLLFKPVIVKRTYQECPQNQEKYRYRTYDNVVPDTFGPCEPEAQVPKDQVALWLRLIQESHGEFNRNNYTQYDRE